jgi:membrane protein YqaA with SNARE-associated domain
MEKLTIETHVEEAAQQAGGLLRSRYGLWALAGLSFVESALLVPIITDPFLIAYILADKKSVYKGVFVTLASSVLGGIFAYTLAFSFYEFIAQEYLVGSIGEQFYSIVDTLQGGVFVVTLLGAVTPIPYTLVALGAGFVEGNLLLFIIASILGRGSRYAVVGFATYMFGEHAIEIIRRRLFFISVACIIIAVGYFLFLH